MTDLVNCNTFHDVRTNYTLCHKIPDMSQLGRCRTCMRHTYVIMCLSRLISLEGNVLQLLLVREMLQSTGILLVREMLQSTGIMYTFSLQLFGSSYVSFLARGQDYKRFSSMSRCSTHNLCSEMTQLRIV